MSAPMELLTTAGAAAAVLAVLGLLLVLPLYLTQRREVARLLAWREAEPERGDGAEDARPDIVSYRDTGAMTPAERVTADRPALERITAERAALQSPSFWRRLLARGPRHPVVLSVLAVVLAAAAVAGGAHLLDRGSDEDGQAGGLDRSSVKVAVLNGSSRPALAGKVADTLEAAEFDVVGTGVAANSAQTIVLHDNRQRRAATAVGRELGVRVIQPFDRAARAAAADADIVVIAGEDRARA